MLIYKLPKLSEYIIDFKIDPIGDRVTFASYNHKIESRMFEIVIEPEHKITNEWALVYVNDLIYVCKVQQTLLMNKYIFSIEDKMTALYYGLWEAIFDIDLKYFYWPDSSLKYNEKYSKEVRNHFFGDIEIPRKLLDIQEQTKWVENGRLTSVSYINQLSLFLYINSSDQIVIQDTDENVILEPISDFDINIRYKDKNYYFYRAINVDSSDAIYNLVLLTKQKDIEGTDYSYYAFPVLGLLSCNTDLYIGTTRYELSNYLKLMIQATQDTTFKSNFDVIGFFNAPPYFLTDFVDIDKITNIFTIKTKNLFYYNINYKIWLPKIVLTNRTGSMVWENPDGSLSIRYNSYKKYDYVLTEPSSHYNALKWQSLEIRDYHLKFKKKQGRLLYADGLKLVVDEVTIIDYGMDLNFPIENKVRDEYLNIKNAYNTQVQSDAISFFTNPKKSISNPLGTVANADLIQGTLKMQNAQKMNLLNTKANIESTNIEALRLLYNYTTPNKHIIPTINNKIKVSNSCFFNSMLYPFEVNNYDSINVNTDINNLEEYGLWNYDLSTSYGNPIDVFSSRKLNSQYSFIRFFLKINDYRLTSEIVDKYPSINHITNAKTIFFENIQNGFFTIIQNKPNFKEIELSENKK